VLSERPGDDAAHELRARALMALGRLDEAEVHAADAVRLDPDEIRYRELLAEVLSQRGAHRDAAAEYRRLARNDPRQPAWTLAEARERLGSAQPEMSVEAAQRAVKLDPRDPQAQLALSRALARVGDARGALQAATLAAELLPGDPAVREALADASWLADRDAAAFAGYRALALELHGADRERVTGKARTLYRQRARPFGRALARIGPLFGLAFRNGWISVPREGPD
ncbi:MAG: tetratricopeptide repeat protein, partial [Chloroflexota bacterium]|nr:tetratricopeptide repeat protein [Chloroflexota bacterium]